MLLSPDIPFRLLPLEWSLMALQLQAVRVRLQMPLPETTTRKIRHLVLFRQSKLQVERSGSSR